MNLVKQIQRRQKSEQKISNSGNTINEGKNMNMCLKHELNVKYQQQKELPAFFLI